MRVYVKGFGCSSSLADAEVLAGCLARAGYEVVASVGEADVVVFNTCGVKAPTEDRMLVLLKKVPEEKRLVVAGCLPVINFERLQREVCFDGVGGPAFGEEIVDVVRRVADGEYVERLEGAAGNMPSLGLPRVQVNPRVSVIPVSYGCLGSCAYCCVRFARGELRSHRVEDIVREVRRDYAVGVREFWLTSQDMGCYGWDLGVDLAGLLEGVCGVDGDFLVRVGMMTPNRVLEVLDRVVEAFRCEKVFKFLHLPVQSGDDGVLRGMNRFYSVEDFVAVVDRFREMFPWLTLATDVIVGFPGESEEAFRRSCRLVEEVKPDVVNVSKFFARPNTVAAALKPTMAASEVKRRSGCLVGLAKRIALEQNRRWVGWRGRVLVDEVGKEESVVGRNFAYKPVVIRGESGRDLLGRFVSVKVVDAFRSYLLGALV